MINPQEGRKVEVGSGLLGQQGSGKTHENEGPVLLQWPQAFTPGEGKIIEARRSLELPYLINGEREVSEG